MSTALRPNPLNIDFGENKQAWLDYCKAHSTTPSEALRQIVAKLTAGSGPAPAPREETRPSQKVRREIRFT